MRGAAVRKVTTVLDVLGLAAVTTGVALLSIPIACIVLGVALLLISWRASR